MSNNNLNIYQRMSKATALIQTVSKNLTVETTKGKGYKAVSERDILDAVKPIEIECGIYSYPAAREILESQTLETESQYGIRTSFMTRIKTVYRFVNIDNPSEFIETTTFAEGIDSQDKGSGKGMTYGDKYALMKAYKISTGDDPDQEASKEEHYTKKATGYFCVDCEKELKETNMGGKVFSAAQLAKYTLTKYGKVLCPECASRAKWVIENESSNNEGTTSV